MEFLYEGFDQENLQIVNGGVYGSFYFENVKFVDYGV